MVLKELILTVFNSNLNKAMDADSYVDNSDQYLKSYMLPYESICLNCILCMGLLDIQGV